MNSDAAHPRALNNPWLICRTPRPGAVKLYCFAHSGGSAGEFAEHLKSFWPGFSPDV